MLCALMAAAAATASLAPIDFPAWPAATLGILGIALSTRPGSALGRALSAFVSLAAFLIGVAQIALMYGAAFVLD